MVDNNFQNLIILGDEWIISYLLTNPYFSFGTVRRFSIAHALEQYLKANITKKYGYEEAVKKSHDLFSMYRELRSDLVFLPEIEKSVFESYAIEHKKRKSDSLDIKTTPIEYLLLVFKYIGDLKYNRPKGINGQISIMDIFPDERYAEIIYHIRHHLGFDSSKYQDLLRRAIDEDIFDKRDKFRTSKICFLKICVEGKILNN